MTVSTIEYNSCVVVKMVGRVDSYTSPNLEETLNSYLEKGQTNLVFDMSDVSFISSKGLRMLTEAQITAKNRRGKLVLANIDPIIEESFKLVGLAGYFETYPDLTEAVGSF